MNKFLTLIIFFGLSPFLLISQNKWSRYDWNAIDRGSFPNLKENSYKFNLKEYKDNIYIGKYDELFAGYTARAAQFDVDHGNFFFNFDGQHDMYLRKVLETAIGDTSITNKIKIYIYNNINFNASMDGGGNLRLNIGYLAEMESEAELASTIAHEVAHFLNHDGVKHFGQFIESFFQPPQGMTLRFSVYGIPVSKIDIKWNDEDWLWYSRMDESAADFTAINFIKKSGYSLKGMSDKLRKFKNDEIKAQIRFGEQDADYSTHPDPGNRMKQVKALSNDSTNVNKKMFIVNKETFLKIKEKAACEIVNTSFINNQLDILIERSFRTYLFYPENKYSLSILVEALRRTLLFGEDEKIKDRSFILHRYQTRNVKKSKNYEFLNEETPSVLKNLTKGFAGINKSDMVNVKALDLLDTSKIKFVTNHEAYNYFKQKSIAMNNTLGDHYQFFDTLAKPKKSISADTLKIKNFTSVNDLFYTNSYLKNLISKADTANKSLFVILPSSLTKNLYFINKKTFEEQDKFYDTLLYVFKPKTGPNIKKLGDLSFNTQHLIYSLLGHAKYFLDVKGGDMLYKSDKTNWLQYAPELYNVFEENNVTNIYLIDVNLYLGRDKKSYQECSFYKISLPGKKTSTFSGNVKSDILYQNDKDTGFYKKLIGDFGYFYSQSRTKLSN